MGSGAGKGEAEGTGADQRTRKVGRMRKKSESVGGLERRTVRRTKGGRLGAEWETSHVTCMLAPSGGWRQKEEKKYHVMLYVHFNMYTGAVLYYRNQKSFDDSLSHEPFSYTN